MMPPNPPFHKLLVANRGEIAVRIIRACRALGVATVAVYSDADRGALHTALADEAYHIGPAPAAASYLLAERIVEVARQAGAGAVHPGYGFLSERAHFAQRCRDAGLVFVGPPPEAIALMGAKIAAKRLAAQAGVPTVPGYTGDDQRPETLRREAGRVGFPLLIKASAGGGGRGMRSVHDPAGFDEALEAARREARAAFGDDTVFLERLIARPRHVEVQVLADAHGNVVHLFERECSIQRRHQKIVEESPSPALSPALRAAMGEAAVRLARAAGYVNAGTVEFLLDEQPDGDVASEHTVRPFYFLEMNTRLQVEHPVTEAVTGLDLVQLQIAIAAGAPLPFHQEELAQRGHAIEVRVCAEDPVTFLPAAGRLALFDPPAGPGVRNDAGVRTGDELTVHYDPMFAKLIVHAHDRPAAIALLRRSLDSYAALGVTTNLPLLRAVAAHPGFAAGATHTGFLEEHSVAARIHSPARMPPSILTAAAIAEALTPATPAGPPHDPWDARGWAPHRTARRVTLHTGDAAYAVDLTRTPDGWDVSVAGESRAARVLEASASTLVLALAQEDTSVAVPAGAPGECVERFRLARAGELLHVLWRGHEYALRLPAPLSVDALGPRGGRAGAHAGLEAPMPGSVVKVLVREGQEVAAHQPLVVLEAMKMEHIVAAPHDGVVRRIHVAPGALVARGAALAELDER